MVHRDCHKGEMPARVLHVTWGMGIGGKERFLDQLMRGVDSRQFSQRICCLRERGAFYAPLDADGYLLCFIGKRCAFDVMAAVRLRQVIRESSPDVIHAHDFTSHLLVFMAIGFRRSRPRVVATLHGGHVRLSPFKSWLYLKLLRRSDRVVCVAAQQMPLMESQLGGYNGVVHTPYGVDTTPLSDAGVLTKMREQLGIPQDAFIVAMVARFEHPKDQDSLVQAAAQLLNQSKPCFFILVGDGSRRKVIESQVATMGLSEQFRFVQNSTEVGSILAATNVCVLPSFHEGLPISILEYMAAGKPVVASDVGGVRELVRDGKDGFVIPAGDVDALMDRLSFLFENSDQAMQMGSCARAQAEQVFSLRGMLDAYTDLYWMLVK